MDQQKQEQPTKKEKVKINKTTNYDMFVVDHANRGIRKNPKLFRSMKQYGWLTAYPMFCKPEKNGKKIVLDGQHRLEVARELKIPVLYVCDESAQQVSIPTINIAQMPWKGIDYLSSYCNQGVKDYLDIKEYCEATGIKLMQAVAMFAGEVNKGGNQNNAFKSGTFRIKNVVIPTIVGDMVKELKAHISWATDDLLVAALARACCVKDFKPNIFKQKVAANPGLLRKQPNLDSYAQLVEEIYNFRSHCPIPLKFLCEQEMRKRTFSINKKAA